MDGAPSFALFSENHSDMNLTKNYLFTHSLHRQTIHNGFCGHFFIQVVVLLCVCVLDLRFRLVTLLTIFLLYWIFPVFYTNKSLLVLMPRYLIVTLFQCTLRKLAKFHCEFCVVIWGEILLFCLY